MTAPDTLNAWTLFTRSWRVTLGTLLSTLGLFFLLLFLPVAVWIGWLASMGDAVAEDTAGISCLVLLLFLLLVSPVVMGAIAYSAFQYLRGEKVPLGESLRATLPCFFQVTLTLLAAGFLFMLGYMACLIPGFIVYAGLYVAIPVAAIERVTMPQAIARSWNLTRGYRLSLFLFLLLMQLISYAFLIPMSALETVEGGEVVAGLVALLALPVMALSGVVSLVSYGVAYHDLRHLQEGDLGEDVVEIFD